MILLEVKTPRDGETPLENMVHLLSSFLNLYEKKGFFGKKKGVGISLEIGVFAQSIHFYIAVPELYIDFITSQVIAQYPKAVVGKVQDVLPHMLNQTTAAVGELQLSTKMPFAIKTLPAFQDADPLSGILGFVAKSEKEHAYWIQIRVSPTSDKWRRSGEKLVQTKTVDPVTLEKKAHPYAKEITEKISYHGFSCSITLAALMGSAEASKTALIQLGHSFATFSNPSGAHFMLKVPSFSWQKKKLIIAMIDRKRAGSSFILNLLEVATIYHFPTSKLASMGNIAWHKGFVSEAPDNLPIAEGKTDEEKKDINFIARTYYKNAVATFGIKSEDRRKHVYVIGKTGSGKSTLIANMLISDIRNGKGVCVVDPHGDLCTTILDYIPSYRLNDVIYVDPSDKDYAYIINPLEVQNYEQKELVVSGLVAIFKKIYMESWGPRLEYILRNVIFSVIDIPGATLLDIPRMLTDQKFREKSLQYITDPVMLQFWKVEFAQMGAKLTAEAVSPILNKVGQFTASPLMRKIIGSPKSTINLEKVMNEGKILLLNVSQGKMGEDNAALLGAMTITKLQLAAMNRVNIPEAERRDFYLYVDEFQNFATSSFIKILSEARKYRLNLTLANQYIAQIPLDVRAAIFGNAGTVLSFLVGAEDAGFLTKEFGGKFTEDDLLSLGNFQAIIKLAIDGITRSPFVCQTLPLPASKTQNKQKAINNSHQRYAKKV